jgi:predicted dehydrogenase
MSSTASPLRFAVVGCGRMGRHHAEHLRKDGRAVVTALFDPHVATAQQLNDEWKLDAEIAPSFEALAQRGDVDAVILCTPTGLHYEQSKICLANGWHVLCEKPLANSRAEILELIERARAAEKRGQIISIGYQRRYWSGFRTLRKEIASGVWGPVRAFQTHCVEFWQPSIAGTWRDDPRQNPGGFIGDAGSHKIDMLFHLTGLPPREVFARTWKCGSRVEIVASISAVLGDDVPCTIDFLGRAHHLGEDASIHCADADLLLRQDRLWIGRERRLEPLPMTEPDSNPVSGLIDAIQGLAPNHCPADSALPVYDFTQAVFRSAETGENVRLPFQPELIPVRKSV